MTVIGATNDPTNIDDACLSRLQVRLMIGHPNRDARQRIVDCA